MTYLDIVDVYILLSAATMFIFFVLFTQLPADTWCLCIVYILLSVCGLWVATDYGW